MSLPKAVISKTTWDSEVYPPSDDSFTLVDAVEEYVQGNNPPCSLCLEVGCGSGYVITSVITMLKALGWRAQALATDINPAAALAATQTLANHGVHCVDVVITDLLGGMVSRLHKKVGILVFNPPYVPTPSEEVYQEGITRAWAGGKHGREIIDQFLPIVPELLTPGGQMFMVTVSENNPSGILSNLHHLGLQGKEVLTRSADEERLHILRIWRM